jgi:cytochrome o ubiquinol oxidase subunit II
MRPITKLMSALISVGVIALIVALTSGHNFEILNPAGEIATRQRQLLIFVTALSLVIVLPVFALTYHVATKYRADNPKARYEPDWGGSRGLELLWWAIPGGLIAILAVVTFITSHSLDPKKPIASDQKPLHVQVISLNWKWLFIYPEQNVASVNYLMIPEDTPVEFDITSEGAMNAFSIPQLGGQMYAMAGMNSKHHLIANQTGTFRGQSTNLSGEGFAGMTFDVVSTSREEFDAWASSTALSPDIDYERLVQDSINEPQAEYSVRNDPELYNEVMMKYMGHGSMRHGHEGTH